jgi:predicted transcriptional regulator
MATMTLTLPGEIDEALDDIARRKGISKAEAMKRAFALLVIADRERRQHGHSIGIVHENEDYSVDPVAIIEGA